MRRIRFILWSLKNWPFTLEGIMIRLLDWWHFNVHSHGSYVYRGDRYYNDPEDYNSRYD